MRLLCDSMLGSLAKWLRWLGHDTEYARSAREEEDVIARALAEGRLLVTMSAPLVGRARSRGAPALLVLSRDLDGQLEQAVKEVGMDEEALLARCGECNTALEDASPGEVADLVPPAVLALHHAFRLCRRCGRAYWEGTHFRRIEERIGRLRPKSSPRPGSA
jgi:hypothetical protein